MDTILESVQKDITIAAPPERVFDAWADPELIAQWYVERAEGDPRAQEQIAWVLGGEAEPLAVRVCEPPRRLELVNAGDPPWKGSVVALDFSGDRTETLVSLTQSGFAEALRDHVPNVDAGWACMLAVLKEYVEHHFGRPRRELRSSREFCPANAPPESAPDLARVARALGSSESVAEWSGEPPSRLLALTPRGAVLAFAGFAGVFIVMGVGAVSVAYVTWGDEDPSAARELAEALADGLLAYLRAARP